MAFTWPAVVRQLQLSETGSSGWQFPLKLPLISWHLLNVENDSYVWYFLPPVSGQNFGKALCTIIAALLCFSFLFTFICDDKHKLSKHRYFVNRAALVWAVGDRAVTLKALVGGKLKKLQAARDNDDVATVPSPPPRLLPTRRKWWTSPLLQ